MSRQFLLSTTRPDHPNHKDITEILKRLMKNTLASRFKEDILVLAPDEVTNDNINYKEGLRTLHTNGVKDDITKIGNNKILNEPAPSIAKTEQTLPRSTRTTLAQLRSGYSTFTTTWPASNQLNTPTTAQTVAKPATPPNTYSSALPNQQS